MAVYNSVTGNVERMAYAVAEGAKEAGGKVTVKRVEAADPSEIESYDGFAFRVANTLWFCRY
mgnify:CR=1 FL=1